MYPLFHLRRHIVLLITIRPSHGDVKPGSPLGAFREELGMNQHRVSPYPFLSSSSPTQYNYTTHTVTLTSTSYSTLFRYCIHSTRNVVCPSGAWFENRSHSTSSIRLAQNPKHVIMQWVGIATHTHTLLSIYPTYDIVKCFCKHACSSQ